MPKADDLDEAHAQKGGPDQLYWTRRVSLTARILAVNIFALALLAGSLFYLDSYRKQLLAERFILARAEAEITADALEGTTSDQRHAMLIRIGQQQNLQLRLYDGTGKLTADTFQLAEPSFQFINPDNEPWYQHAARILDRGMDFLLGAPPVPAYLDPENADTAYWPEIAETRKTGLTAVRQRYARDRTPVITAATPVGTSGEILLTTRNDPGITQSVRDFRQTLAIIVVVALFVSIQLSLFLARTIVQPLRTLVRAAVRVRLGRDREVIVPRLPERGDEIGLLARAVSDMTTALRHRIDAVESFAADVAHEIKNPLASLRSALETLGKVEDPALRHQLNAIAAHDVHRIDRLVTEIAEASRIDAELSRTTFEPVNLTKLAKALIGAREQRRSDPDCTITLTRNGGKNCTVLGDAMRLERVLENLLDNAVSFSPTGGTVEVTISRHDDRVELAVQDEGPGIPFADREKVFERFHSVRPDEEDFGRHSGLGLAIARTIIEAHDGTLTAQDRLDGHVGTRMVVELPAMEAA